VSTEIPLVPFSDRRDAGERLAHLLAAYRDGSDLLVLGIPRGGVPVAAPVARALGASLDVIFVRKHGVPGFEELAIGATASGGFRVINEWAERAPPTLERANVAVAAREAAELARREELTRGGRKPIDPTGRTVILVDDGLATGAAIRAAVAAVRARRPARVVVAVPVAPVSKCSEIEQLVDRLICVVRAADFRAVGEWYEDFTQTTDDEVRRLLEEAAHRPEPNGVAETNRSAPAGPRGPEERSA
jgi:predicted phosphoribosyltransferase